MRACKELEVTVANLDVCDSLGRLDSYGERRGESVVVVFALCS